MNTESQILRFIIRFHTQRAVLITQGKQQPLLICAARDGQGEKQEHSEDVK